MAEVTNHMAEVRLTEDLLAEEAHDAQAATEDQATVAGIRRRFDRQVGLLRALPEGWYVVRTPLHTHGDPTGFYFVVYGEKGGQLAQARRQRSRTRGRQSVSWAGCHGGNAGDAWAQGIALLFAAIDAEARGDVSIRESVLAVED